MSTLKEPLTFKRLKLKKKWIALKNATFNNGTIQSNRREDRNNNINAQDK